jgi:uncharacterized protein YggE
MEVPMRRLVGCAVARFSALIIVATLAATRVTAQVTSSTVPAVQPPAIAVTAIGESRITPDRAMLHIAVESQGETAAAAAAANAAKQTRVIDAVKAAGVAAAQIRTAGYNVYPEYAQPGGRAPRVTGYRANNTVQVEVRALADLGKIIDASLAAGATNIGGVGLFASNTDAARREAVQQAVGKARAEAEAAASAAGGSLGPLLELSTDPFGTPRPLMRQMGDMAAAQAMSAAATPIETGESVVQAVVHVRWQFVPNQR